MPASHGASNTVLSIANRMDAEHTAMLSELMKVICISRLPDSHSSMPELILCTLEHPKTLECKPNDGMARREARDQVCLGRKSPIEFRMIE